MNEEQFGEFVENLVFLSEIRKKFVCESDFLAVAGKQVERARRQWSAIDDDVKQRLCVDFDTLQNSENAINEEEDDESESGAYFIEDEKYLCNMLLHGTKLDSVKKDRTEIENWFEKHDVQKKQKIGLLYTENYVDMCFETEKGRACSQNYLPPRNLILLFALCDARLPNFSPDAEWADEARAIFDVLYKYSTKFVSKLSIVRLSDNFVKQNDFHRLPESRKHTFDACLVRCLRVLLQSECKLFECVAYFSDDEIWPRLSKHNCICSCANVEKCKHVDCLVKEYGFDREKIVHKPFDVYDRYNTL